MSVSGPCRRVTCHKRATVGNFGQATRVRSLLRGIGQPVPEDRRRKGLCDRLATSLDDLRDCGVLTAWKWAAEGRRGSTFLGDTLVFLYHRGSVLAHAVHRRAAWQSLALPAVQRLLPDGLGRSAA